MFKKVLTFVSLSVATCAFAANSSGPIAAKNKPTVGSNQDSSRMFSGHNNVNVNQDVYKSKSYDAGKNHPTVGSKQDSARMFKSHQEITTNKNQNAQSQYGTRAKNSPTVGSRQDSARMFNSHNSMPSN